MPHAKSRAALVDPIADSAFQGIAAAGISASRAIGHDICRSPEAGAGQALVKVSACAVCRTDLHVVDGDLVEPKLQDESDLDGGPADTRAVGFNRLVDVTHELLVEIPDKELPPLPIDLGPRPLNRHEARPAARARSH